MRLTWKRFYLLVFHPFYSLKRIYKKSKDNYMPRKVWQFFYHPIRLFRLKRIDKLPVPDDPGEIRLFLVVRNEVSRLPYFWEYYKKMGVDRFFVLDNGSTDGTLSFLLNQENTHVFCTRESYANAFYGMEWQRILLNRYGRGYWCVTVDADEFFIYPHYEELDLKELSSYLDNQGYNTINGILIDMYARVPLKSSGVKPGEDPLRVLSYFDRNSFIIDSERADGYYATGGLRHRVFGLSTCLNKVAFFKYSCGLKLWPGFHFILNDRPSDIRSLSLHCKFNSDSIKRINEEVGRKEHWREALEYKAYAEKIREDPDICLFYHGSLKFESSGQLVELGVMKTSDSFEKFALNLRERRKK